MGLFFKFSVAILFAFMLMPVNLNAAVSTDTDTIITAVRVESNWGFISYADSIASSSCPGHRVYVNLTTDKGKTVYSSAMAAMLSSTPVKIRAVSDGTKVFGACELYDIYMYLQS